MKTKEQKEIINNDLDSIFTSNKYWVTKGRSISDKKFQEILDTIGDYFKKYYETGRQETIKEILEIIDEWYFGKVFPSSYLEELKSKIKELK